MALYNTCKGVNLSNPTIAGGDASGALWTKGYSNDSRYVHVMTPNMVFCDAANDGTGRQSTVGASSRHSGGVNLLFCDGSVKFIKDSIAAQTWWALGTRANSEVVSADQY
jgi:prepilin-type processing-associated H-X9-DG protein